MPGAGRSSSTLGTLVGIAFAAVAVVGYVVFGWRFDGSSGTLPVALALLAVAVAVGWELFGGD